MLTWGVYVDAGRESETDSAFATRGIKGIRGGKPRRLIRFSGAAANISADIPSFDVSKSAMKKGESPNISAIWEASDNNKARLVRPRIF